MKDQVITIKNLVSELIQRNETLISENELLKKKLTELEESVIDKSENSINQNDAIDRDELKKEIDHSITELDKCINKTQRLIEESYE